MCFIVTRHPSPPLLEHKKIVCRRKMWRWAWLNNSSKLAMSSVFSRFICQRCWHGDHWALARAPQPHLLQCVIQNVTLSAGRGGLCHCGVSHQEHFFFLTKGWLKGPVCNICRALLAWNGMKKIHTNVFSRIKSLKMNNCCVSVR